MFGPNLFCFSLRRRRNAVQIRYHFLGRWLGMVGFVEPSEFVRGDLFHVARIAVGVIVL
jgi:hypothetical protein